MTIHQLCFFIADLFQNFPPDQERKESWVLILHRADFTPSNKYFDERFIILEDTIKRSDGIELVPRKKRKSLTRDGQLTFHENLSLYLTRRRHDMENSLGDETSCEISTPLTYSTLNVLAPNGQ